MGAAAAVARIPAAAIVAPRKCCAPRPAALHSLASLLPPASSSSGSSLGSSFVQRESVHRLRVRQEMQRRVSHASGVARAGLISPDGGVLVDLIVPEKDRSAKNSEASGLPRINITRIDLEWVHVVSEGWASPLRGFMRQDQYLQALHFNSLRMPDGTLVNMSVPIVLAIDDSQKEAISGASAVTLVGPLQNQVAILRK